METRIFLARHGVTRANIENRFAGRTAEALHAQGIAQIKDLAEKLQEKNIEVVYTGPLARTIQSAEILAGIIGVPVFVVENLNDIYLPHWDGLLKEEIRLKYGDEYPTWLAEPHEFKIPHCETLADVQKRATCFTEELFSNHAGKTALIISHLIVLRCLALHYQGRAIKDFRLIKINNGDVGCLSTKERTGPVAIEFMQ